jgi:hypothetical protein
LEGSFAVMFAEITLRRLNAKGVQKKRIDPDHFVNRVDLPDFPYTLWSDMIEKAVVEVMRAEWIVMVCLRPFTDSPSGLPDDSVHARLQFQPMV